MSLKLIETFSDWGGGLAVLFTILAAAAGLVAWYFSGRLATAREEALTRFQSESKVSIATANERAQEATARAEEARLKTAQIQSLVEWRTLSAVQIRTLQLALSVRPSSLKLTYVANDPEALFFAAQISKGFENWTVVSGSTTFSGVLVIGVTILGRNEADVNFVRNAFVAANIPVSSEPIRANAIEFSSRDPGTPPPTVEIIVGSKERPGMFP